MTTSDSSPRELPLLLGPSASSAESLVLLGMPDSGGVVHVRIWSADNWSAPPRTRAERASALLEWLERETSGGRTMNQSLTAVRLWLRGEGSAPR